MFNRVADGEVTILKYRCQRDSSSISVPSKIEGLPVTIIGNDAFIDCENLTSIALPDSLIEIGGYAFCKCSNLTSIVIPEGVRRISYGAFSQCLRLKEINLPASVIEIDPTAFEQCISLGVVRVDDLNPVYSDFNGVLMNKVSSSVMFFPAGWLFESISIPEGTKRIGQGAFSMSAIGFLFLPASLEVIEPYAFCNSQVDFILTNNALSEIGEHAFAYSSLYGFVIPDGITQIQPGVFSCCPNLELVFIPNSVTKIAEDAFKGSFKVKLQINKDSYAEEFAKNHGIHYTYVDINP